MGSLADLIVATSSDAEAIVASEYPLGSFKGVNVDSCTFGEITGLAEAVINKSLHCGLHANMLIG